MKKLYVAPFDTSIFIYRKEEKEKFKKAYGECSDASHAITSGNGVWMGEYKDLVGVCYHEAVHLVDWLLETRLETKYACLWDSTEMRAYLVEYVGNAIRRYCCD